MNSQFKPRDEVPTRFVRERRDDGITRFVIDFGVQSADIETDIVGDTLIIVGPGVDEQRELTLPPGEARTFMKNGVLTIEIEE